MTPDSRTEHFFLTRSFSLPPARLWHLLTDPKARELWGAPSDDAVLVLEQADLREGGHERHRCGPADAPEFIVDTVWIHIEAPRLACFTETVSAGGARLGASLVTYALTEDGAGSALGVDVAVSSMTGEPMREDFHGGWSSGLARLHRLIEDGTLR